MTDVPTGEDIPQVTTSNLKDTSQVSDKPPKITSNKIVKLKDPKRVEAGKKLASISKASKEKKAREKFEAEIAANRALAMENSWNIDYGFVVGAVGVAAAVGTLYLTYRQDRQDTTNVGLKDRPTSGRTTAMGVGRVKVVVPKTQASNIEMFD